MRTLIVALIFYFQTAGLVIGQTADEKDVAAAVESLRATMVDPDKGKLEALVASELSYGHSSGKIDDKTSFIESLMTGASDFASINLTDQTIKVAGTTAIVRHKFAGESLDKAKGTKAPINLHVLTIWQKQGVTWKLLARQAIKI
ncbi:MAG TPA: nuclear transport factor 2 family protein [Cyclobacteriaceae bacterium]|nr:nuclear transport factor 2 family protein [Cyclobacteriaceae bacterium]